MKRDMKPFWFSVATIGAFCAGLVWAHWLSLFLAAYILGWHAHALTEGKRDTTRLRVLLRDCMRELALCDSGNEYSDETLRLIEAIDRELLNK